MTTYFWEDTAVATGVAETDITPQVNETAVGTGIATKIDAPSVVKSVTAVGVPSRIRLVSTTLTRTPSAAIPVLVKMPMKVFSATGTGTATKIYTALKTLLTTGSHAVIWAFTRSGADAFAVINAERKWESTTEESKWQTDAYSRFSYTILGN